MTTKKTKFRPEGAFLKNNPTISPDVICQRILDRTEAIIYLMGACRDIPDVHLESSISQLKGNIKLMQKVLSLWSKAATQGKDKEHLSIDTTGLVE